MFYYYGAKNQLAKYYPYPEHNLIIEPFAGSAAYSCFHLLKNKELKCLLIDKDEKVAECWNFLLNCSEKDIINYPTPKINEQTSDFLIMTCAVSNASSKCKSMKFTERLAKVFNIQKNRILKLFNIRDRIQFKYGEYFDIKNEIATWFIDPPYQIIKENNTIFQNGNGYSKKCNSDNINYKNLGEFCLNRNGQIIVCEKSGANWLDFQNFRDNKTSLNKKYKEVIFIK